ncbi:tripartite tricarboxylate transporter substrate binding protein BugE [Noviherbaspirillum denitrificans]|uniref:ABC transporter substrate-binding protein n=1 Tax=Noviherbaspirillum denitrificans TaxID=1968433 RepID=A0A254TCK8_9BURK|nr:tripartite tricarboxylate transporter substrate binding protein BugE [Noviherbaspirillum denitrificans]OWW20295.1 ABC transporter substrate-binding protein [Noviherbaspirillum denitrificans]
MKKHAFIAGIIACMTLTAAHAQNYPTKPIKFIIPFAPGGTTDIVGRIVADKLGKELGQAVVVENRAGGGGSLGASALAKSDPDGYTIGMATVSTHAVNVACNPKLAFDPLKDTIPITNLARTPNVLTLHPSFPAQDYSQFIAHVRKNPGQVNYASAGTCSIHHMMGEAFNLAAGTQIVHVPYRGSGPALNDLLGGQIGMMFDNLPSSMSYIKAGKIRPIAVAWNKRLEAMPNVPTFAELGIKQVNDPAWYGVVAPARTPEYVITKIHDAAVKVLQLPEVRERLVASGAEPVGNTPTEYGAEIKAELEKMKNLVQKQGIKFEGT